MSEIFYSKAHQEILGEIKLIEKFEHPKRNPLFNLSRFTLCSVSNKQFQLNSKYKDVANHPALILAYNCLKDQLDEPKITEVLC